MSPAPVLATLQHAHSALEPAGPAAARIEGLWWFMTGIGTVVYLAVIALLLVALFRRRRSRASATAEQLATAAPDQPEERRLARGVSIATVLTVVILLLFLGYDFTAGRSILGHAEESPLSIEVTGHQWWWEIRYPHADPSRSITTANEIHIPVGREVQITGLSTDVIHSFWAPNFHGKRDLITGYRTTLRLRADSAGVYEGECAEFCGLQHAKMRFVIVAEPPERFEAWAASQRAPAAAPADSLAGRGQAVFLTSSCVMCHAIQGTPAGGRAGPDLTHLASRRTLASGTLPNTRGYLAAWILDPQGLKPGTNMPSTQLEPADLQALLAYLEGLR